MISASSKSDGLDILLGYEGQSVHLGSETSVNVWGVFDKLFKRFIRYIFHKTYIMAAF